MTDVYITESAWHRTLEEIVYFADHSSGQREAVVYPMFGFKRVDTCRKAPWEMLTPEDIDYFIVTDVFTPPREYTRHTGVFAGFKFPSAAAEQEYQASIDMWVRCHRRTCPALDVGNIHSHPFAKDTTWPSQGGDATDYPRIYRMWQDMRKRCLDTPLEIIFCRSSNTVGWEAHCFGFGAKQKIIPFGLLQVVSDHDPRVSELRRPSHRSTNLGRIWERYVKSIDSSVEHISVGQFGWVTVRRRSVGSTYHFFYLPPGFPRVRYVLIQILNNETGDWGPVKRFMVTRTGYLISFRDLIARLI